VAWSGPTVDLPLPDSLGGSGSETPSVPRLEEHIEIDGFLMPGVVDRHVHVAMSDPGAVVIRGVTAVRDLGWPSDDVYSLAEASESPSFNGPLIRAVGPILTCAGGYPTRAGWAPPGTGREVRGPEEATEAVGEVLDRSDVAVVKVALNAEAGPTLTDQELVAICDAAHGREAIVTVHAEGKGQVERALGAGVDEFAHCPWSERLSEDLIEAMAKRTRIVSTLDIHSYGSATPELGVAIDNLRRFLLAGGTVVYGTDLGNGPIPPGIHPGEISHLFRAGLSPEGILRALTFRPLEPGEPASLIALGGNPLETVDAYEDVRLVLRSGRRLR
jgi:imidazolonepropionase-like amidohydrolase